METRIDSGMNWTLSIIRGDAGPDAIGDDFGSSALEGLDLGEETWAWLEAHGCPRPEAGHSEPYQHTWVLVTPPGECAGELANLVAQRGLPIDMSSLAPAYDR